MIKIKTPTLGPRKRSKLQSHGCDVEAQMFDFIKVIADELCYEMPGEYLEDGESGHALCLSCRARAIIAKAEGRRR